MIENGLKSFEKTNKVDKSNIQILFEITLSNLKADGEVDEQDFLDRADLLCSTIYTVMISNYMKFYKIIEYLSKFTKARMGVILGVDNLLDMFKEKILQESKWRNYGSIGYYLLEILNFTSTL